MMREIGVRIATALGVGLGLWGLAVAAWDVFQKNPELVGHQVLRQLPDSGVEHPVTAVLLNFRAYDTMLELMVLIIAFWGVWSLGDRDMPGALIGSDVLLDRVSTVLVPMLCLVAVYLLWAGAYGPGGEFQAGAVLGACGVLMLLVGRPIPGAQSRLVRRLLVTAGGGLFIGAAAGGWMLTGHGFGYRPGWEKPVMLVIEAGAAISVGFILTALFAGSAKRLAGQGNIGAGGGGR